MLRALWSPNTENGATDSHSSATQGLHWRPKETWLETFKRKGKIGVYLLSISYP